MQPLYGLSQPGGQHKSESKEILLHVGCCVTTPRCPQIYVVTYQMDHGMHRIMIALPKAQTRLCACPHAHSEVHRLAQRMLTLSHCSLLGLLPFIASPASPAQRYLLRTGCLGFTASLKSKGSS